MRLALASDDFEWDDEEEYYYDDNVLYVYDSEYSCDNSEYSCDNVCIERIRPNPPKFNIVDGRVVIGGKA